MAQHLGYEVKAGLHGGTEILLPGQQYPTAQPISRSSSARQQEVGFRRSDEGGLERRGGSGGKDNSEVIEALAGIRREVAAQLGELKADVTALKVDLNAQTTALTEQTNLVTGLAVTVSKMAEANIKGARLQQEQQEARLKQQKMIEALTKRLDEQYIGEGGSDGEASPLAGTGQ